MQEIKYFIGYVINYKKNVKELADLTERYDSERSDVSKAKKDIDDMNKQIKFLTQRNEEHMETIKEKNKELRVLKKENKFLMERENKLQQIEEIFKGKRVVLKDLKELVTNDRDDN